MFPPFRNGSEECCTNKIRRLLFVPQLAVPTFYCWIKQVVFLPGASAVGDANAEHDIYDDDAICDHPQSGKRILGRSNLQALRSHHPGKPSGFEVKRILGNGDLWITEYTITYQGRPAYTVSIMEFRNGEVDHETQYFGDPFEAPAWRRQWVQQIA
jgi:hypothetical protein